MKKNQYGENEGRQADQDTTRIPVDRETHSLFEKIVIQALEDFFAERD